MALRSRRTKLPRHRSYQRYKPALREDFAYACVYCELHENEAGGPRFFTVEHFRPKSRFPALTSEYSNLLYACAVCNGYKGDDWPSDDPLRDGRGYLDPCEHDYAEHFGPAAADQVAGRSAVGRYMVERLHLNRRMLRTLRQQRRAEEETQARFEALFERNLALLDAALAADDLDPGRRESLEQEVRTLREQYAQCLESWSRRWVPRYGMDDYR